MSTLANMRKRFYARFDESSQAYIPADEANALINEGASHLHNWLVTEGEAYVWQETSISLVAGQSDYALPVNLLKLLKVFVQSGRQQVRPIPRIMPQEYRGITLSDASTCDQRVVGYMMMGQTLRVLPKPSGGSSLLVWWAPIWSDLGTDTDTTPLVMFPGAEEFIVNQAVIGARIKEESDTQPLERRQAQIQQMIQQTIINRDMGQHARVVDAYDYGYYNG